MMRFPWVEINSRSVNNKIICLCFIITLMTVPLILKQFKVIYRIGMMGNKYVESVISFLFDFDKMNKQSSAHNHWEQGRDRPNQPGIVNQQEETRSVIIMQPAYNSMPVSHQQPRPVPNQSSSEILKMPSMPARPTLIQPSSLSSFHSQNVGYPNVTYSNSLGHQSSQGSVSSSVRDINQQLEHISNRIKDGRPVQISYGEGSGRGPLQGQQRIVQQNGGNTLNHQPQYGNQQQQGYNQHQTSIQQNYPSHPQPSYMSQPIHISQPLHPSHPSHPQIHPQPQSQTIKVPENQVQPGGLIKPQSSCGHEQLAWKSRYLSVMDRFKTFSTCWQEISQQFVTLREEISKCQDPVEIHQFQQQMVKLQKKIFQIQQGLISVLNRNKEQVGSCVNWKEKYDELLKEYQAKKMSGEDKKVEQVNSNSVAQLKQLQMQLKEIQTNHDRVVENYESENERMQEKHESELSKLKEELFMKDKQYRNQLNSLSDILQGKEEEISTLRLLVDKQQSVKSNQEYSQNQNKNLVGILKREKQQVIGQLNRVVKRWNDYKDDIDSKVQEYKTQIMKKNDELKRYQYLVMEKTQTIQKLGESQSISVNSQGDLSNLKTNMEQQMKELMDINNKLSQENKNLLKKLNTQGEISGTPALKELHQRVAALENSGGIPENSIVSSNQAKIDIDELNQNIQQLQKLYSEKCLQHQKIKATFQEQKVSLSQALNQIKRLKEESMNIQTVKSQKNIQEVEGQKFKLNIRRLQGKIRELQTDNHDLRGEIDRLEVDYRKVRTSSTNQVNEHVQLLEESITKKDKQISRLRQSSQLLQSNIDELTIQHQKLLIKTTSGFKASEGEKGELKNKLISYEFKISEYERKVSSLEEVKLMLQQQVTSITTELHAKLQTIQKHEAELRQERAKTRSFQADLQVQLTDTEENKLKLRQSERKTETLIKSLQFQLDKKKEESMVKASEMAVLNGKIHDLERHLKAKESAIAQLQKNSENLKYKISGFDSYIEEIKYLKQKITEYESKVSSLAFKPVSRTVHSQPTQIFERKVIYQLKLQNEALRQRLSGNGQINSHVSHVGGVKDEEEVRQRLTDFNHRLEELISENFNGDIPNQQTETIKRYERDRRQLIEKHNEEITQLKVKVLQIQSTGNFNYGQSNGYTNSFPSAQSVYNQQIVFYRQKNQELEERVDSNNKVNRQLKEYIQRLMKGQHDEYSISYYKQQLISINELYITLQQKYKKIQKDHQSLKEDYNKTQGKPVQNHAELQNRIVELNRRISQLVLEISQLEQDRTNSCQKIEYYEKQIIRIKIQLEENIAGKHDLTKRYREKEKNMEEDEAKLNSKIRMLTSEIERLNELINKRQLAESVEINSLRIKLTQSGEDMMRLRVTVEEYKNGEEKYQREIRNLQGQLQGLYADNQSLKQTGEIATRKHKEYDTQITNFRITISDLEGRLRSKDSVIEQYTFRESQFQQQISRLNSQISILTSQSQRNNEYSQKKLTEKEQQIQRLTLVIRNKDQQIVLLEEQLGQSKVHKVRANETGQQVLYLEEELGRLRSSLSLKNSECDRKGQEVLELQGRISISDEQIREGRRQSELRVTELQIIISRLEMQLKEVQTSKESAENGFRITISSLQTQLRQLQRSKDQQINELTWRIKNLQSSMLQSEKNKVEGGQKQLIITQLQQQLQHLQRIKDEEIARLKDIIGQLENQCQQLTRNSTFSNSRIQELQRLLRQLQDSKNAEINQLNITIRTLRVQIQQFQGSNSEHSLLVQRYRELQIQYNSLVYEKETIQRQLLVITQRLSSLEVHFSELKKEKEQKEAYYIEVIKSLEQQIVQLKSFRADSEGSTVHLEELVKRLQAQLVIIRQQMTLKDNQLTDITYKLTVITEKISTYQLQINRLKETIIILQTNFSNLDSTYKLLLSRSSYTVEYLRSIMIDIETLLAEEQNISFIVGQQLTKTLTEGLDQCEYWHTALL